MIFLLFNPQLGGGDGFPKGICMEVNVTNLNGIQILLFDFLFRVTIHYTTVNYTKTEICS